MHRTSNTDVMLIFGNLYREKTTVVLTDIICCSFTGQFELRSRVRFILKESNGRVIPFYLFSPVCEEMCFQISFLKFEVFYHTTDIIQNFSLCFGQQ